MSNINTRLAESVVSMLSRHGFDVTLQQRAPETTGDFDAEIPAQGWVTLATVRGVWDNPRTQWKGVNDSAPASVAQRRMTIAYRDDLKQTEKAVGLCVVVDGVPSNVLSVSPIGDKVGLRLMLEAGTEA